jgi:hypothetical protein
MAREAETNPRIIPDATIAERMIISVFLGAHITPKVMIPQRQRLLRRTLVD